MTQYPIIVWLRRDLRLADQPALHAAAKTGRAVIPVFIADETVEQLGAAPKWRLGLGLEHFAKVLAGIGSRLILRRGEAGVVLKSLIAETGADTVFWSRLYDPDTIQRDTAIKADLGALGVTVESFNSHLIKEPWEIETKTGGYYKVYSPFWRTLRDKHVALPLTAVRQLTPPATWPASDRLDDWQLGHAMQRGAAVVGAHVNVGEARALDRMQQFLDGPVETYKERRDFPAEPATSGLSENLTYGEISPRVIWHAALGAMERGAAGAEHFLKEIAWREFAYHLIYHTPHIAKTNWRDGWQAFPWRADNEDAERWRQGRTGEPIVDAAMRELYVTGIMHNRCRMIVASYLTKHLMVDWRVGQAWFAETLVDWDAASNAMGWQWVAGCGPDASPFFRIFNPQTQQAKFDGKNRYLDTWLAEGHAQPDSKALSFYDAIPQSWNLAPNDPAPTALIALAEGRVRALEIYKSVRK